MCVHVHECTLEFNVTKSECAIWPAAYKIHHTLWSTMLELNIENASIVLAVHFQGTTCTWVTISISSLDQGKGSLKPVICSVSIHCGSMYTRCTYVLAYRQLRARRALLISKDVQLRNRRALLLYNVYGDSALLVLSRTSLKSDSALLALNWRFKFILYQLNICVHVHVHVIGVKNIILHFWSVITFF